MDIFWGPKSIISEPVRAQAELLLKKFLTRDLVLTLVSAIGDEGGIGRGTIGQCVHAIVALAPQRRRLFESIIFDQTVDERERYWVVLMLIADEQHRDRDYCVSSIERALASFSDESREMLAGLRAALKAHGYVDLS